MSPKPMSTRLSNPTSLAENRWNACSCQMSVSIRKPANIARRKPEARSERPRSRTDCMPAYFTPELFRFLTRLKRNNKREWFQAHKEEYVACAFQPAIQFITDFAGPLYEISPHLIADPRTSRGSLFRIYRDTRFSADKKPYKTHLAMRFSHRGKDVHSPGFYLHLEPGGSFAASGLWHPEPPTLLKVRNAIVSRPKEWREVRKLLNWGDAG